MSLDLDAVLRGPESYSVVHQVLTILERHKIWPTPLNIEIWSHYVAAPDSPLGHELAGMLARSEVFTESMADDIAAQYLSKDHIRDQIRDAGHVLRRELTEVTQAIESATTNSINYGTKLDGATRELATGISNPGQLVGIVQNLQLATQSVQSENEILQQRLISSSSEVERLREHLEQVKRDATIDALTNLANRRAFDEQIDQMIREHAKAGTDLTLAMVDIDHFKKFNDTWGHQVGDQVLRYVASILSKVAIPPRFAARYGGEEFALLFPGMSGPEVEVVMDQAREQISSRQLKRRSTAENLGTVTVSVGIAQANPKETGTTLIGRTDGALYASKHAGRNQVTRL